jgi:hypothetical protein
VVVNPHNGRALLLAVLVGIGGAPGDGRCEEKEPHPAGDSTPACACASAACAAGHPPSHFFFFFDAAVLHVESLCFRPAAK